MNAFTVTGYIGAPPTFAQIAAASGDGSIVATQICYTSGSAIILAPGGTAHGSGGGGRGGGGGAIL